MADTDRLTRRQAAILSVFTGVLCGPFEDVQKLGDDLCGRPTWTHEYGSKAFVDELKELARPLFLGIVAERHEGEVVEKFGLDALLPSTADAPAFAMPDHPNVIAVVLP